MSTRASTAASMSMSSPCGWRRQRRQPDAETGQRPPQREPVGHGRRRNVPTGGSTLEHRAPVRPVPPPVHVPLGIASCPAAACSGRASSAVVGFAGAATAGLLVLCRTLVTWVGASAPGGPPPRRPRGAQHPAQQPSDRSAAADRARQQWSGCCSSASSDELGEVLARRAWGDASRATRAPAGPARSARPRRGGGGAWIVPEARRRRRRSRRPRATASEPRRSSTLGGETTVDERPQPRAEARPRWPRGRGGLRRRGSAARAAVAARAAGGRFGSRLPAASSDACTPTIRTVPPRRRRRRGTPSSHRSTPARPVPPRRPPGRGRPSPRREPQTVQPPTLFDRACHREKPNICSTRCLRSGFPSDGFGRERQR